MRQLLVAIALCMGGLPAYAQEVDPCCATFPSLDSAGRETYRVKKCHRERNYLFARQTLLYAPLSFVTGPYMDQGFPKKNFPKDHYILSADIVPQFVIGGKWMPIPIHFTPRFVVRIFDDNPTQGDSSLPVRTPSYMPGATAYFPLTACESIASSSVLAYLSASVFHHSNGQDGYEFKTAGSELNHYNGNFSTNFVEGAYHFRLRSNIVPVPLCQTTSGRFHEIYGKIGVEQHFATADSLKSSYGRTRINLRLGTMYIKAHRDRVKCVPIDDAYRRETWRIVFNGTYIAGKRDMGLGDLNRRVNADLNLYRRIPSSPNTAGFVGVGYYGSDPYNIYYDAKPYMFVRIGLAMGFFYSPLSSEPRE